MSVIKNKFKSLYKNIRFKLSSKNNFLFIGYYRFFYKPKKGSLSELINNYSLKAKNNFTVIQIGANDGITHDPIHKFIKTDKWNGVLLEPQKEVFDKYLSKIYKKDKGIICLNAALGEKDGIIPLYKIKFSNSRWATGLASFNKDVLLKGFESGYIHRKAKKEGIIVPEKEEERIYAEQVQMISFNNIIKKYNIKKIDLVQIDTEGFDFEIIKLIDFENIKPEMIIYEETHLTEETKKQCYSFLEDNGYKIKKFGGNIGAIRCK